MLHFHHGLPYVPICPYTDEEWDTLPHVIWTSDEDWDPCVLDDGISDEEVWYDAQPDHPGAPPPIPLILLVTCIPTPFRLSLFLLMGRSPLSSQPLTRLLISIHHTSQLVMRMIVN